jgi:hypothetical protein
MFICIREVSGSYKYLIFCITEMFFLLVCSRILLHMEPILTYRNLLKSSTVTTYTLPMLLQIINAWLQLETFEHDVNGF